MLEIPDEKAQAALKGVMMELEDCAFPLLAGMAAAPRPKIAFKDVDVALLVGARPAARAWSARTCCEANGEIFTAQGRALDEVAKRNVKVLVVGNPGQHQCLHRDEVCAEPDRARTSPRCCAWITTARCRNWPRKPASRSTHREAGRVGQPLADHVSGLPLRDHRRRNPRRKSSTTKPGIATVFIPTVGKRGAAIIEARGLSSAASAANAAIDHVRDWVLGSNGKWVTMGVPSDGSYGIPEGRHVRLSR